jgi:hypothetical protein
MYLRSTGSPADSKRVLISVAKCLPISAKTGLPLASVFAADAAALMRSYNQVAEYATRKQ